MPYAILRFEKRRGGSATAIEKHHERQKEAYQSNADIDRGRKGDNYHIKAPKGKYYYEVQSRIEAAKCRIRRDSVKFVDTFIGGTNSFVCGLSPTQQREYFQHAYNFIRDRVGEHNIFSATVHMDETTPHLHLCFVPLTKDKRLSAKEVLGDRKGMVKWQDDFHAHMSGKWPELERGQPASETKRKHIPVRLYKQSAQLNDQIDELRCRIGDTNIINVGKRRKELIAMLEKWYLGANRFNGEVKSIFANLDELKQNNACLVRQLRDNEDNFVDLLSEKDTELLKTKENLRDLVIRFKKNNDFVNSIPEDLFQELAKQFRAKRAKQQAMQSIQDDYEIDDD